MLSLERQKSGHTQALTAVCLSKVSETDVVPLDETKLSGMGIWDGDMQIGFVSYGVRDLVTSGVRIKFSLDCNKPTTVFYDIQQGQKMCVGVQWDTETGAPKAGTVCLLRSSDAKHAVTVHVPTPPNTPARSPRTPPSAASAAAAAASGMFKTPSPRTPRRMQCSPIEQAYRDSKLVASPAPAAAASLKPPSSPW